MPQTKTLKIFLCTVLWAGNCTSSVEICNYKIFMYLIKILKLKILVITYGLILQILRTTCLLRTLCIVRYFIELKVLMPASSHTHTQTWVNITSLCYISLFSLLRHVLSAVVGTCCVTFLEVIVIVCLIFWHPSAV